MMQGLLVVVSAPRQAVSLGVDTLQLSLATALFKTANLEKRLMGLTFIKDLILRVTPRRDAGLGPGMWSQSVVTFTKNAYKPASPLDEAFVLRWLVRHEVVEELFGSRMHLELVTRAEDVLKFLASKGAIETAHLEAIWACTVGKHEAVVRVLYRLMVDLVPHLTPEYRIFLFNRIAALPFARYDAQTLQIVHDFTLNALRAQRERPPQAPPKGGAGPSEPGGGASGGGNEAMEVSSNGSGGAGAGNSNGGSGVALGSGLGKRRGQVMHCSDRDWFGFGVLWQFLQDDQDRGEAATLSVELTEKAVNHLVALLNERECAGEREALIDKSIANLRLHR